MSDVLMVTVNQLSIFALLVLHAHQVLLSCVMIVLVSEQFLSAGCQHHVQPDLFNALVELVLLVWFNVPLTGSALQQLLSCALMAFAQTHQPIACPISNVLVIAHSAAPILHVLTDMTIVQLL
jgi:hypothetical protein